MQLQNDDSQHCSRDMCLINYLFTYLCTGWKQCGTHSSCRWQEIWFSSASEWNHQRKLHECHW